jgi:uncharacterized RDD family membrane protein YckC
MGRVSFNTLFSDHRAMDLVALQGSLDNLAFAILFAAMLAYWVGAAFPRLALLPSFGTMGMAIANLTIAALDGSGLFPHQQSL